MNFADNCYLHKQAE